MKWGLCWTSVPKFECWDPSFPAHVSCIIGATLKLASEEIIELDWCGFVSCTPVKASKTNIS